MRHAGAFGGENVGMSNRKSGENPDRRKPKVSSAMSIIGGLGATKHNPTLFADKKRGEFAVISFELSAFSGRNL